MEWLPEGLLRAKEDMGLLKGQLTHALACRHCSSIICLQSPGNLVILVLFLVWQIQRWWQLGGRQQLPPWCSGDKVTKGKGLQLLYHLAFFDCLWKQKSEEEEEDEEKKEKERLSLNPLKPYHPSKDTPIGNGFSTALPQPSCRSEDLPRATGTQERMLMQSPRLSRSFPTFQTLTNLTVSSPQQTELQLFSGLPSLHSEFLETIFLSSDGPSPLKLSICPSVFSNKVPFPPVYNLLLPCYHSSTYYPTPEAHILEDLEEIAPGSQLVQFLPSPSIPLVSSNLKPLLKGYKRIIPDTEAHTQWFTQNKEVPSVPENQALYPQPELQKFRSSTLLYSSEVWRKRPEDLSLHQHNPGLPSASLLYPSKPQEVLDRYEMPWITMKQNEHPKASETAMPTASPLPISLTEHQRVNPTGDLSQVKTLCETTAQKENPHIYEPPISAPCQLTAPMTEGTGPSGTPPGYKAQWGILAYKGIPQASDPLMPASYHPSGSLSEVKNVNPKERLSAPKDFRENMGYRENPPVPKSPLSAPYPPLDTLSEYQRENPLEDGSGLEPQRQCKETSGSPWASETPTLDFHVGFYEATPMCVPLGSEAQLKGTPSTENLCVYADLVSSPSLPSASLPDFAEAPSSQGEAVSEVYDHPVIHAWQWSRQLKLRLNKLQQSPTFKSPGPHHSFCSSPVLNLTLESWGPSSCPQQIHPLSLRPCSSSRHPPKVPRAEALPVQAPHCSHSSSQPQVQASGRAEQQSQKSKRMKWKAMARILPPGHGHMKADENCSGMGEPPNTGLPVSAKRQDKTLVLSTQKRGSSRKFKAEKCGRAARLGSPTVTRKNNPAQACRPAEASIPRFSKKFQCKAQSSPHSALAQQLLPNAAGPQDRPRTGLVAGDTQNPCPCKCCPWIPIKKQLSSSSPEAPPTRGFQKLIDKFLVCIDLC
ncbi:uncharacterized protein C9orf131 homolog [Mus pahari]|uniref:uncharacterized protein C9orf131 homolog n=1 Tax=Mus pahari TaxID=10093 RepID=UPI000A310F1F|nr:uncharacterized protein C9orf131 homolog [Mus pahari]